MLAFSGNVIPVAIARLASWSSHHTVFFIGAAGTCLVPLLVTGLPASWTLARRGIALAGLVPRTMMQAYSGGSASGYCVLMMMAMVWFGLQAGDRDILIMIAGLCACSVLPMILFGAPAYPIHWANAALLVVVGATGAGALRISTREITSITNQLRRDAATDPLTGLLNRRGWQATAPAALARSKRSGRPVAAAVFDLNSFKELNDRFGHGEGDRVLQSTAERLRATLRAGDVLARSGGDEFVALLLDTTPDDALLAAQHLADRSPGRGSITIGLAIWTGHETLEELLRRADLALYDANAAAGITSQSPPRRCSTNSRITNRSRRPPPCDARWEGGRGGRSKKKSPTAQMDLIGSRGRTVGRSGAWL